MKQAQSLSLNVVIVAAILIIVLFVVVLIFTGKIKGFTKDLENCEAKGGECAGVGNICSSKGEGYASIPRTDCGTRNLGEYCCIKVL